MFKIQSVFFHRLGFENKKRNLYIRLAEWNYRSCRMESIRKKMHLHKQRNEPYVLSRSWRNVRLKSPILKGLKWKEIVNMKR